MRQVDTINLELSLHNLICGRNRRNIKQIESATNTAIYFPPLFPTVFGYSPAGAFKRSRDEIILTGDSQENILQAKKKLHDLVITTKTYVKDVVITTTKVDYILLERLDKIKKIVEHNGSYVLLPPLGNHTGMLRVQATDILNVERTVKEIMSLVSKLQYTLILRANVHRPVNFTAPPGGSPVSMLLSASLLQPTSAQCCRISVSTLVPKSPSKSSTSTSTEATTLSSLP